jgi:hypothetical protein
MRIRDVTIRDVFEGRNWRLTSSTGRRIVEWKIEVASVFADTDEIVYSALSVYVTGEVRALLLIREVGTYEWWGDMVEYVEGAWRALQGPLGDKAVPSESFVAAPLENDPSFMGEYSHEIQRRGFARWRDRLLS